MRKNSGMTLIELIIVIVIVSICFFSIMSVFMQALNQNFTNEIKTTATFLAEEKMEEILYTDFDKLSEEEGQFSPPFSDYQYRITWDYVEKSDLDASVEGSTEYKNVKVYVNHSAIDEVILTTLFSDYQNKEE